MGCFNVACSASKISIGSGDPAVFVLLLPSNYGIRKYPQIKGNYNKLESEKMLIYSNCYYEAFSLPIKGFYNDYGGLEKIKKTPNVLAIESYFGIPIQKIIGAIGQNRGYCSDLFDLQKYYLKDYKFVNDKKQLDAVFLKKMGFNKIDDYFCHDKIKLKVKLEESKLHRRKFRLLNEKDEEVIDHGVSDYECKHYFMENISNLTGYYLGVKDDQQEKLNLVLSLSGMFIHGDIYSDLVKGNSLQDKMKEIRVDSFYLKKLGFKIKKISDNKKLFYYKKINVLMTDDWTLSLCNKDGKPIKSSHYLGSLSSLNEIANELDVSLNWDVVHNEPFSGLLFDKLREKVILINKEKELSKDSVKFSKLLKKMKLFIRLDDSDTHAFSFLKTRESQSLYNKAIEDGSIRQESIEWSEASDLMYSMNCHFFPAMNGEQSGNNELTKRLLEKSLEIVNKNIKKYEEE